MHEIDDMIKNYSVNHVTMKGSEGIAARGKPFVERVEMEAIVYLVGANHGIRKIPKKVKSTVAKDFGLKGKAHYLNTDLDTSLINSFSSYSPKVQEAILVAWSELS